MNEQSIYVSGSNYFNNDDLNNMTRLLEEGKTILFERILILLYISKSSSNSLFHKI